MGFWDWGLRIGTGIWDRKFGIGHLESEIWDRGFGNGDLESEIWDRGFGIRYLGFGIGERISKTGRGGSGIWDWELWKENRKSRK